MDGREARLREELHRKDAEISRLMEELSCQQEGAGQVSRRLYIITETNSPSAPEGTNLDNYKEVQATPTGKYYRTQGSFKRIIPTGSSHTFLSRT